MKKTNKLETLIDAGYKIEIQSNAKFCLILQDTIPCVSFNADNVEEAIDSAYYFVKELKTGSDKTEIETETQTQTSKQTKDHKTIIDIPQPQELKIDEDILNGEFKMTTTIRLYSEVWGEFKDFAETYKEYKSMDLVSMALLEYIEKYKE
ncbi:hypothetical protein KTC92_10490 [Clostridium sp. CM027]|uniref:hypothetical protein n=1 Tax=Clostridium sp. CM027 TaxID=2849865 RepID=UPI001C6E64C8|nr:hypothetical protein [Clostridium sp. CM027]MBW9147022.1 hypothetical protein [Clostridium sp. CM027]UVE39669.1 hypothetical protein KTC92_10490 [Clostridium sp. CM027]